MSRCRDRSYSYHFLSQPIFSIPRFPAMKTLSSLFFLICFSLAVTGQTFRGGIQGTVTDSSGAVLPGADVKVTNLATGFTRTTQTGATGDYFVSELPIGSYDVTVTAKGFRPATAKSVKVTVSASQDVNVQLSPGDVTEVVVIAEQTPLVDAVKNTLGATLDSEQFNELPVSGRDFTKLLVMVP